MTPEEQYISVCEAIDALEKQKDKLKAEILANHTTDGEIIPGLRRCTNQVLNPEKLKENVTSAQWQKLTERKVVAAYLTAEIKRGKLAASLVESCKESGNPYLKRV